MQTSWPCLTTSPLLWGTQLQLLSIRIRRTHESNGMTTCVTLWFLGKSGPILVKEDAKPCPACCSREEILVPGKKFCPVCVLPSWNEKEKHETRRRDEKEIDRMAPEAASVVGLLLQLILSSLSSPVLFSLFCLSVLRCSIYRLHFLVKPLYVHSLQTDWSQCQSIPPGDPNNDFNCYLLNRRFTQYSFQATILLTEAYNALIHWSWLEGLFRIHWLT